MPKIFISAGEASGDLHAGAVAEAILRLCPQTEVYGMGGSCLREAGGEILFDIKDHGVMGLVGVMKKLPALFALKKEIEKILDERRPDCVLTIDYSEFNTYVVAKAAHARSIPIVSFIPPSAWAWRQGRARYLAQRSTVVATIFPFEHQVYLEAGANSTYVGHPLIDIVKPTLSKSEALQKAGKKEGATLILLLPGSRRQEIEKMLPVMLEACVLIKQKHPEVLFCMPKAATISMEQLDAHLQKFSLDVKIIQGHNYDIMQVADLAIATSGTVTLEAALCGLPSIILYKTSALNALIFRNIIKVSDIGLPNIVMGKRILPELLQEQATPTNIAMQVQELLRPEQMFETKQNLAQMRQKLGAGGAINKVAKIVLEICGVV